MSVFDEHVAILTAAQRSGEEFRKLVADMRAAQKQYFRDRSPAILALAKVLEKRVDQALDQAYQPGLFDGGRL